jgi:hypothetical protein
MKTHNLEILELAEVRISIRDAIDKCNDMVLSYKAFDTLNTSEMQDIWLTKKTNLENALAKLNY